ncbi:MAG: hypothetical protein IAE80_26410 [Anaerolinea sp.]|nr:hypothetical protein [Anaerolinea sp.]
MSRKPDYYLVYLIYNHHEDWRLVQQLVEELRRLDFVEIVAPNDTNPGDQADNTARIADCLAVIYLMTLATKDEPLARPALAAARQHGIPVLPILVQGANEQLPRELTSLKPLNWNRGEGILPIINVLVKLIRERDRAEQTVTDDDDDNDGDLAVKLRDLAHRFQSASEFERVPLAQQLLECVRSGTHYAAVEPVVADALSVVCAYARQLDASKDVSAFLNMTNIPIDPSPEHAVAWAAALVDRALLEYALFTSTAMIRYCEAAISDIEWALELDPQNHAYRRWLNLFKSSLRKSAA